MVTVARLGLTGAMVAAAALTGCIDFAEFGDANRFKDDFHYSYALNPGGTLSLENYNGSVEISGWDQNKVQIDGTKYASTKALLDAVKIDAGTGPGLVHVRTIRPDTRGSSGVHYTIHVPHKAMLDTIATTNGSIKLTDIDGNAHVRTTNGTIHAEQLHGELEAQSSNGSIEATGLEGNARVRTTNGKIQVESTHGGLDGHTSNGPITATLNNPPGGFPVRLHSSNGPLDLRLTGQIPDVRADTSNSPITLHLPAGANASVHATTSHGSITSDFDVTTHAGTQSKTELDGNIGSGGPSIDLTSSNGSIKLLKQ